MVQIDMEMPNSCFSCPLGTDLSNFKHIMVVCRLYHKISIENKVENKPDWCPLVKPVGNTDRLEVEK